MIDETRSVPTQTDADGVQFGNSIASPTENKVRAEVCAPAPNVIPIIFIPGIMGSNLRAKMDIKLTDKKANSTTTLAKRGEKIWCVDSRVSLALTWKGRSAAQRQLLLNKDAVEVDTDGKIEMRSEELNEYRKTMAPTHSYMDRRTQDMQINAAMPELTKDKRNRGWGTVSWQFYGDFLQWLEVNLQGLACSQGKPNAKLANLLKKAVGTTPPGGVTGSSGVGLSKSSALTEDMLKHLTGFYFPVHARGYNWLASNLDSGDDLANYIAETIKKYDGKNGQTCKQVIVITHSMGGLVARAAAMASGAKDSMLGIIHGVMPTHGAGAFYKRMAAGFSGEKSGFLNIMGSIAASALGNTARETLPVLAYNPGPLELAPNHRYNHGKPWLFIKDKQGRTLKALPEKGDPYAEIYRNTQIWWRAVNAEWLNPAQIQMEKSPSVNFALTLDKAESYHRKLADTGFHPNSYASFGRDISLLSWGSITWNVVASQLHIPPPSSYYYGSVAMPYRTEDTKKILSAPETWQFQSDAGEYRPILRDNSGGEIQAAIAEPSDAGDGTVPEIASAEAVASHCKIACFQSGYEHSDSYNNENVHLAVMDAIARMVAAVPIGK